MSYGQRLRPLLLAALAAACARGQGKAAAPSPVDEPTAAASGSNAADRGADAQLRLLRGMPRETLERIARGGMPDASGAVGHNRTAWMGAQYQRSAALYFLYGAAEDDTAAAEDAWRAVDLAFSHESTDGSFGCRNESGAPAAMKDVYSDAAFWLAQYCQAALVAQASPLSSAFRVRIEQLRAKVRAAASLLLAGRETLVAREAGATNRYFIDALAYGLSGVLLGDPLLTKTAASFVELGLERQHPEGFFEESGGSDTSYNCVSILMLQVYDLYFPDPRQELALAKAVQWELEHVLPTGEIEVSSNSRTGLGQEQYFGKRKEINYGEAVLALLYDGAATANPKVLSTAARTFSFRFGP
jgi:hypothetical protein